MPTNKPEVVLPELPTITRYRVYGDIAYPVSEDPDGSMVDYDDHVAAMHAYGQACIDTLTRPADGEYDRELIAEMLDDLLRAEAAAEERGTTEGRSYFNRDAIAEQARLLRAADNRDAAGVHAATVNGGAERHFYPAGPVGGWRTRCGCGNDSANFAHLSSCASSPAPGPSIGGFVMVPREPTGAMLEAAMYALDGSIGGYEAGRTSACYRAMLSAAPQQPAEAVALPPIVREVLEWYASDPSIWVGWTQDDFAEEEAAKKSGHYRYIGEDKSGHNEYVPNHVRAEEALIELDQWLESTAQRTPPPAIDIGKLRQIAAELRDNAHHHRQEDRDVGMLADEQEAQFNEELAERIEAALIGDGGGKGNG